MVDTVRNTTKRRMSSISPPAAKRKQIQSTTTKVAVSSFFVPISQKAPEKLKWQERAANEDCANTLLIATYTPSPSSSTLSSKLGDTRAKTKTKIAAFDFDSTLVATQSGNKFAKDAQDWKWWHHSVPARLKKICLEDGYTVVIISNQGAVSLKSDTKIIKSSHLASFKGRISGVTKQLDIPLKVYAATEKDNYRKPRSGIWKELLDDLGLEHSDIDLEASIFVGDAAGRVAQGKYQKDFSCSDRNFAENVGLPFQTPEEFFLDEPPRTFVRDFDPAVVANIVKSSVDTDVVPFLRTNDKDIVVMCGSPGAGKSTAYWTYLKPLGYERVNQDLLKSPERCLKVAETYLQDERSVVVDNTNADLQARKRWISLAKKHNIPIRCLYLTTDPDICAHNNVVRALNEEMNPEQRQILPEMAFNGFKSRFQEPSLDEGFEDIIKLDFKFRGTDVERAIWSRYWT